MEGGIALVKLGRVSIPDASDIFTNRVAIESYDNDGKGGTH